MVFALANSVKILSQCAKNARRAMWCDLTLTKAMAAKPKVGTTTSVLLLCGTMVSPIGVSCGLEGVERSRR